MFERRFVALSALAFLLCGLGSVTNLNAASADLDTSFDSDGIVFHDLGASETGGAVVQLTSGKLLQFGNGNGEDGGHAFTRFNADGSVDTSFGEGGTVAGLEGMIWGLTMLPGEGWFIATHVDTGNLSELNDAAIVKYEADGSPLRRLWTSTPPASPCCPMASCWLAATSGRAARISIWRLPA